MSPVISAYAAASAVSSAVRRSTSCGPTSASASSSSFLRAMTRAASGCPRVASVEFSIFKRRAALTAITSRLHRGGYRPVTHRLFARAIDVNLVVDRRDPDERDVVMATARILDELDQVATLEAIDDRELTVVGTHHGHVRFDEALCRFRIQHDLK